jgi:hypothetical protein
MPFSGTFLDYVLESLLEQRHSELKTVVDLGVGAGKVGRIVRAACPSVQLVGYEIDQSYLERFSKEYKVYDTIVCDSAMALLDDPEFKCDLVCLGDVIEHLRKSDGVDLLNFLVYRTKFIYVQFPEKYIQNPSDVEGHFYEAHISVWSLADFTNFSVQAVENPPLVAVCVDGYLPHTSVQEVKFVSS